MTMTDAKIMLTREQVLEILDRLIHKLEKEAEIYGKHNLTYTIKLKDFGSQLTKTLSSVMVATVNDQTVIIEESNTRN